MTSAAVSCCKVESLISIDERGQMVLPKEIRDKAGIRAGDKLALEAAGFQKVRIIDETSFPIDLIANDPIVHAIIENVNVPEEKIKEIGNSVVSIKIEGIKPGA